MAYESLESAVESIKNAAGQQASLRIKKLQIGQTEPLRAVMVYMEGLVNMDILHRDILNPLMLYVHERILPGENTAAYLCERYIAVSDTSLSSDIEAVATGIKSGKAAILLEQESQWILLNAIGGEYRSIMQPVTEDTLRGSREGFVENLETNLAMLKREIKDKSLAIEYFSLGKRSQTQLALVYIDSLADKDILNSVKEKIKAIDADMILGTGMVEQYIEEGTYTLFPQVIYSERPDRVISRLMEGRIAVLLQGTPFTFTLPAVFAEFFHTIEDYYERTLTANALRLLRVLAVFIVLTLPSIYLAFVKFNVELIPIDLVVPIVQSRTGIPLTPFLEILMMELLVELLREGGLRLPSKIAQTISIVGGIIISDAAVQAKVVSPSTLLIVGITTISSFLIPGQEMSYCIRLLRFLMLVLANIMGIFGIATGYILLLIHLSALKSFGVPYLSFYKRDLKDAVIRAPLWQMNSRPQSIPNKDKTRQKNRRKTQK